MRSKKALALILALLTVFSASVVLFGMTGCTSSEKSASDTSGAEKNDGAATASDDETVAASDESITEEAAENDDANSTSELGKEYVILEGHKYSLPVSFSQLEADGWTFDEDEWLKQWKEDMRDNATEKLHYVALKGKFGNYSKEYDGPTGYYTSDGKTVRRLGFYNSEVYWRDYTECDAELSLYGAAADLSDGRVPIEFGLTGGVTPYSTVDEVREIFQGAAGADNYNVDVTKNINDITLNVKPTKENEDLHFEYEFKFDKEGKMLYAGWEYDDVREYDGALTIRRPKASDASGDFIEEWSVYHFDPDTLYCAYEDVYLVFPTTESAHEFAVNPTNTFSSGHKINQYGCVVEVLKADTQNYDKMNKREVLAKEAAYDEEAPRQVGIVNFYYDKFSNNSTASGVVVGEGSFKYYYDEAVTPLDVADK